MEKKSFMENAKGFLSAWKNEHKEENKDIIERKKLRVEQAEAMKQEFLKTLNEVKTDLEGKSKDIVETLSQEFDKFSVSLQKGTATLHEKLQIEKRFEQLKFFLNKAENVGEEKIDKLSKNISGLSEFDKDLVKDENVEDIKNQTDNSLKDDNIDNLTDDVNKLFDDIDK
ncbi:MAG: hypothetical protein JXR51_08145 [Bacteroidales bacterium]|nr:hypothetical protein [Bacteroidales bacterium]MBN2757131.1 hypothetical protein [Bacteroidales bacterium]